MGVVVAPRCVCLCLLLVLLEKGSARSECDFGVSKLWTANLRENPITAPPLLFDVDGDGYDDVLVPSFTGEVWGIHGENGHIVDNWPFYLEERAFHSGALVYDVNHDGVLEFLLVTTDAEVLFVQTDNILLHGETIKIPPLRVKRRWYQEDPAVLRKPGEDVLEAEESRIPAAGAHKAAPRKPPVTPFSEFDSRFGRHADPLYSRHETTPTPAGVDPTDQDYVFVDPHVLTTPTIADTDGDGVFAELVVAVSYYFDPYRYGDVEQLERLNGMEAGELVDYAAGGVVIIDLDTGRVKGRRLLSLTRGVDSQPGYLMATPTVVRLAPGEPPVVIIGSVTGELHAMEAGSLQERAGFPVTLDSITAQAVVGDLFHQSGGLDIVVGDQSGNLYCIDGKGERVWERELEHPVPAAAILADVEGDGLLEVVLATRNGDVWVLNGQTGQDHTPSRYPIHLNSGVESAVLVMHLHNKAGGDGRNTPVEVGGHVRDAMGAGKDTGRGVKDTLGVLVPTANSIYIVDTATGCVQSMQTGGDHVIYAIASGDIDPYSPGLEVLGVGLDGTLACFNVSSTSPMAQEEWSMEAMGQSIFTHKASSFYFVMPYANVSQEITGTTFDLSLAIHSRNHQTDGEFSLVVSIGRKHVLLRDTAVHLQQRVTELSLIVPTPPTPTHAFLTVQLCNMHAQCSSQSIHLRFNLHAEEHLKWLLSLPFLSLCALLLWIHRDHTPQTLPTTAARPKDL